MRHPMRLFFVCAGLLPMAACSGTPAGRPAEIGAYHLDFDSGSAAIDPNDRPTLTAIGDAAADNPGASITVVGRADASGPAAVNHTLARQRAQAVHDALLAAGNIAPQRIQTLWVSEKELRTGQPAPGAKAVDVYIQ